MTTNLSGPKCDHCGLPAVFVSFAAYDLRDDMSAHPKLARYPMPMSRACLAHLYGALKGDAAAGGSTKQWLVKLVTASSTSATLQPSDLPVTLTQADWPRSRACGCDMCSPCSCWAL